MGPRRHAYTDPAAGAIDQWCSIGAARRRILRDTIYVAGGGAVTGDSVQSSVHEAFTLAT